MGPRLGQYIALGGKGCSTGNVLMLNLHTNQVATRDQFILVPNKPGIVVHHITDQSLRQGYTRGAEPTLEFPDVLDEEAISST
jgi:hypothetical protein